MKNVFVIIASAFALLISNMVFAMSNEDQDDVKSVEKNVKDIRVSETTNCTGTGGI